MNDDGKSDDMKNSDKQKQALEAARLSLDSSIEQMPNNLSAALAEARKRAMASADSGAPSKTEPRLVKSLPYRDRSRMVWGGAIAASCAALTLSFILRQPGAETSLPLEAEDSMLVLSEMDETEWRLVQELEFALWLSEFSDDATATDFSG